MKKIIFQSVSILTIFVFMFVSYSCQSKKMEISEEEIEALKDIAAPPPSALDALYPPEAELPVYQMKMLEMAMSLGGVGVDFFEHDQQNIKSSYELFKTKYEEVSKLVPEWEENFPSEPIEKIEKALESGDAEIVIPAFEELNNVCHDCHLKNMAKVQHKYQWKDFRTVKIIDPLTDKIFEFKELMQNLDLSFIGIMVDLQQGQMDNVQKHFQDFNARFQVLKDTCIGCHGGPEEEKEQIYERKYYVDDNVQAMVDNLGRIISGDSIDPSIVEKVGMEIGMESCFKCHWVHVPSMYAKYNWEKLEKIIKKE